MANPYHHALSSVQKWGGRVEDYLPIHAWFDASKSYLADFRHRALRHHAQGICWCAEVFGPTLTTAGGRVVPVRWIGEQHVKEDCGVIPTLQDWFKHVCVQPWMMRGGDKQVGRGAEAPSTCEPATSAGTSAGRLARRSPPEPAAPGARAGVAQHQRPGAEAAGERRAPVPLPAPPLEPGPVPAAARSEDRRLVLLVEPGGGVRSLYVEALDLTALGRRAITRASHVEPDDAGQWWADLTPVHGPTLGPFALRSAALAAEAQWLETHWLASSAHPLNMDNPSA